MNNRLEEKTMEKMEPYRFSASHTNPPNFARIERELDEGGVALALVEWKDRRKRKHEVAILTETGRRLADEMKVSVECRWIEYDPSTGDYSRKFDHKGGCILAHHISGLTAREKAKEFLDAVTEQRLRRFTVTVEPLA